MVALQDSAVSYLDVEPTIIFFLEHQQSSNLTVHKVVRAPGVDEDDDGQLLKEPFDLHFLWVLPTQASCGSMAMFFPGQFLRLGGSTDNRWGRSDITPEGVL
ncbi:hypothetical protein B296_00024796 [Ensete ventricosum]|uniref:Uncharacterized protein n=1 Tax=Ensete ventricosum TaxID=4639 RepID=A0A427A806_ENSVE|nr:hypothetical protein B296_00024796 [Ensete ventricosum]